MILQYFGLNEDPFGVTPEPRCLFYSSTHREALASLKYAFESNRGFTALIAPPGMGKTTLLYSFLNDIRASARSAFLFDIDNRCKPRELVAYILRDIGIVPGQTSAEMHEQLNGALEAEARAGRRFALVIDEAQNLSDNALETVRLLTNFETQRAKLMHVVLSGQPQLSEKLTQPSLTQLRQRIATIARLDPLSDEETCAYIDHRLKLAGYAGEPLFSEHALDLIAEQSKGIPRTINNLCFNALSLCRALKSKQVDGEMVAEVIADLELPSHPRETPVSISQVATGLQPTPSGKPRWARLTKLWIPVVAALWIVSMVGIFELYQRRAVPFHPLPPKQSLEPSTPPPADPGSTTAESDTPPFSGRNPNPAPFEITVVPNDTLQDIAIHYLGEFSFERLRQIQALNPEIRNPDHIEAGQIILLPGPPPATLAENAMLSRNTRNLP